MGRKVICVSCINCSYNNIARSIGLLDKMAIFCLYRKIFIQVRAFEISVHLKCCHYAMLYTYLDTPDNVFYWRFVHAMYRQRLQCQSSHSMDFLKNGSSIWNSILIDFSLTVKAATLIFISWRGSRLFHLLNKGNQGLFIIWWIINKLFWPCKRACMSWKS